jgi:pimeloyl-ACP methyl ester carboxylesterase
MARRLAALALALLTSGCAERAAVGLPETPAPIHADCRGQRTASPTVILESGAFGMSADWDLVLDDLARGGRVCAYDRSGLGGSAARAGGRDVLSIAHELGALLDQLGETRPVILVGHSNGALYAETFAALEPRRVAGLLYINGVTSDDLDYPLLIADLTRERHIAAAAALAGQIGLAPLVADTVAHLTGVKGEAERRKQAAFSHAEASRVASDEDQAVIAGLTTARRLGGSPPQTPTAVIFGALDPQAPLFQAWRAAETASALRARVHWVLDAPGATHVSPLVRDRAYVTAAVGWLRSVAAPAER